MLRVFMARRFGARGQSPPARARSSRFLLSLFFWHVTFALRTWQVALPASWQLVACHSRVLPVTLGKELIRSVTSTVGRPFRPGLEFVILSSLTSLCVCLVTLCLLFAVEQKFRDCKYVSLTEFVADVRLLLINCYRFNGAQHSISKMAQRIEHMLEQKIALLPK